MNRIQFNKPYLTGNELEYIKQAVHSGKISGNGLFTKKCHDFFEQTYGFRRCLLTSSCTDALEMAAILADIQPGDEVIIPSYTFVSTANAFVLRGANIIFADSSAIHPNIDEDTIAALITSKTKAIVVVHYAGVACNLDAIKALTDKHNIFLIEDAAQAIDSYYINSNGEKKALGSIGHMAAFSFHETKNIISGEGGMLVVNDKNLERRAEIIWEKGTNRSAFFRGETDKYSWVDIGSSFLPSEVTAAFLWAQLENIQNIQQRRKDIWQTYVEQLSEWAKANQIRLPHLFEYATNNAHMFYLVFPNIDMREKVRNHLNLQQILSVFHYLSLHKSPYYESRHDGRVLKYSDNYSDTLLRLPLYYELTPKDQKRVIDEITKVNF